MQSSAATIQDGLEVALHGFHGWGFEKSSISWVLEGSVVDEALAVVMDVLVEGEMCALQDLASP